jgi:tRNA-dihydrouridine synthase
MKNYLAPLEGVTTFVFRNAYNRIFGEYTDKYFAPFIVPHIKRDMNNKEKRDLIFENNSGLYLVPQILTDNADDLLRYEEVMNDLGYSEININIGCPSGTVSSKGRGAGFLGRKEELDHFLEKVYSGKKGIISVKTRVGIEDPEEFYEILEIYNKYPIDELIIHPRTLKQFYKGRADREIFLYALKNSKNKVVYNGDIYKPEDLKELNEAARKYCSDKIFDLMIGRGVISNPGLFREIETGKKITAEELRQFLYDIEKGYGSFLQGEAMVMFRMKEIWTYLGSMFDNEKILKKIKKSKTLDEMNDLMEQLLEEYGF